MDFAIAGLYRQNQLGERPVLRAARIPALLDRAKGWGHLLIKLCCATKNKNIGGNCAEIIERG
jgi:hypothetical protein